MEEEERKRASDESGCLFESPALKRQGEMGTSKFEDDLMARLSMEDSETDSVSELFKLLENSAEATASASSLSSPTSFGTRVRFSDNPYSSALVFQSSSLYITINGNEESCGSSFSDSESSVMASVDMGGMLSKNVRVRNGLEGFREWLEADEGGALGGIEGEARRWMVGWEWEWEWGWDWDEEQLARFLGEDNKLTGIF